MTPTTHSASVKTAILSVIALLLLIPLSILRSLVAERTSQRDSPTRLVRGSGLRRAGPCDR